MGTLNTRIRALQDRFQDSLAGMSPRDRSLLLGLMAFGTLVVVGGGLWFMNSSLGALEDRVADRQEKLRLVDLMTADHADSEGQLAAIEAELTKHSGTDLSSFMEQSADKAGVRDRLSSVKEKGTNSDDILEEKLYAVSLNNLSQSETAGFLHAIETAGYPLKIRTFKAKRRKKGDDYLLNLTLDVSAYKVISNTSEEG